MTRWTHIGLLCAVFLAAWGCSSEAPYRPVADGSPDGPPGAEAGKDQTVRPDLAPSTVKVWVADPVHKVKQTEAAPATPRSLSLAAAKNGVDAAQIVIHGLEETQSVDLVVEDLSGPGTLPASAFQLYRLHYVNCEADGWIPDSLVPFLHPKTGARIGGAWGAPFSVKKGQNQLVWLEIKVPKGTAAGTYTGYVRVKQGPSLVHLEPITVDVWRVTLADSTRLETYMNFPKKDRKTLNMLHEHRMDPWYVPPLKGAAFHLGTDGVTVIWDKEQLDVVEDYFSGALFDDGVPGKRYMLGWGQDILGKLWSHSTRVGILKQFEAKFKNKPYVDKLYWFFLDEPSEAEMASAIQIGKDIQTYSPSIKWLLTSAHDKRLVPYVGIWDPIINYEVLHYPPLGAPGPEPYQQEQKQGREVINCVTVNSDEAISPNLLIEYHGMNVRIWPWVSWLFGFTGIESWDTVPADNLTKPRRFGKAWGDGSLFYKADEVEPGLVVPSMRLKLLRLGIEDYELLSMLKDKNPAEAARLGKKMAQDLKSYDGTMVEPIKYLKHYWSPNGKNDVLNAPGRLVWERDYATLTRVRAEIAAGL